APPRRSAYPSSPVRLRTHPLAAAPVRAPACARPPYRVRSCPRASHAPPPSTSPGTASPPPPPTAMPRGRRSALNTSEQDSQSTSRLSDSRPGLIMAESGMTTYAPFDRDQRFLLPPDLKEWLLED